MRGGRKQQGACVSHTPCNTREELDLFLSHLHRVPRMLGR